MTQQDDVKKTWLIKRCRTMNAKLRLVLDFWYLIL